MNEPKAIFDRALVRARRGRGQRQSCTNSNHIYPFLDIRCAQDAAERLLDVNRQFARTLVLASPKFTHELMQIAGHKMGEIIRADHSNFTQGPDIICAETTLPFAAKTYDLVISGLSLHAVNHVPRALSEMMRVLKPDGLFLGALFGGETLTQLRSALYEAEENIYARVSPRVSPMITMQQGGKLLQSAGFAMPVIDRDLVRVNYTCLQSLFADIRIMGNTNTLSGRHKTNVSKRFFTRLEHIYKRDYSAPSGKLQVSFEILWLTGWAAHPDQQKPLKPGSAKTRLAKALGVKETKL